MAIWAKEKKKIKEEQKLVPPPKVVDIFGAEAIIFTPSPLHGCVFCPRKFNLIQEFKDDIARREYEISYLCQKCQDRVFKT